MVRHSVWLRYMQHSLVWACSCQLLILQPYYCLGVSVGPNNLCGHSVCAKSPNSVQCALSVPVKVWELSLVKVGGFTLTFIPYRKLFNLLPSATRLPSLVMRIILFFPP